MRESTSYRRPRKTGIRTLSAAVLRWKDRLRLSLSVAVVLVWILSMPAGAVSDGIFELNIPSGEADTAIKSLSRQTGHSAIFQSREVEGVITNAVIGDYSLPKALDILLEGTALTAGLTQGGVITISSTKSGENKMRNKTKRSLFTSIAALFASSAAVPVIAVDETARGIEEVFVTATKRSESVTEVPISISAFTGEDLRQQGIESSMGIATQVPNVQFRSTYGFSVPQFYIRGLGSRSFQTNSLSPVSIYIDSVLMGSGLSQTFQLLDLERAEVLRGPQGTLFGRNTTGGLINFISKKPDLEAGYSGFLEGTYGSYDEVGVEGAINIPMTSNIAGRVAVKHSQRDGIYDIENPALGGELGSQESIQYRVSFGYFGDDVEAIFRIRGGEMDNEQRAWKQFGTEGPPPCPINEPNQTCTDFFGFSDSSDPLETFVGFIGDEENEAVGFDAQVTWDVSDDLTLTYVGAYDEADNFRYLDGDFSPSSVLHEGYDSEVDFTSHELRLHSNNSGSFNWVTGLYYYSDDLEQYYGPKVIDLDLDGIASIVQQETETYSIFGSFEYQLTDTLQLRAGARLTYDERVGSVNSFVFDAAGLDNVYTSPDEARDLLIFEHVPPATLRDDWTEPSGQISLSYMPNDNWHYYVSYSRGFKGGDFNGGIFSSVETVLTDPEFADSYEIGLKATLGSRATMNMSIFHTILTDQQVSALLNVNGAPAQILSNAAESEITGAELDFTWYLTDSFSLKGALGILDAEFEDYPNAPGGGDFSGNTLAYAPELTANIIARHESEHSFGVLAAQIDFNYVDEMFDQPSNDPVLATDSYYFSNAHLSYTTLDNRWHTKLWARNITDEEYATAVYNGGGLGFNGLSYADPRTIGVTIAYRIE